MDTLIIKQETLNRKCTWLIKSKFKEKLSLLIAVQNNAINANYIKTKNDNSQQNNKCILCSDKDKTINHILKFQQTIEWK